MTSMNYTSYQIALLNHINSVNASREALAVASGSTFYTLAIDDLDFWAARGVRSIEDYNAFWDRVEEQEAAKENRKSWYATA